MRDLILALDQGTSGTTTLIMDRELRLLAKVNREFPQHFPKPGWVEHDLNEIWASVEETIGLALKAAQIDPRRIAALGITNQRETIGVWDRTTGQPVHRAIVWQCRRTASFCGDLKDEGYEALFREKTGLLLDPYFSGTKLKWLLDEVPSLRAKADAGEVAAGTIDSFLVWRLTGGAVHITDVTNASRTLLFNIHTGAYDEDLMSALRIPDSLLPQVRSSSEIYGYTKGVVGLPDGIPVAGIAGDQQAALFGQACFQPGDVKCTYGTGAFIVMHTGQKPVHSKHHMLTTIACQLGAQAPLEYALEGSIFCAGSAVQWLRDGLGIIRSSAEVEALANQVESSGEVVFVPALTGLGAPHWRPNARGIIAGITRGTGRAELARATLEGIALQCYDVIEALTSDATEFGLRSSCSQTIRVDGGAAANHLLMQLQADLCGRTVVRPDLIETTAAGAAFLAGIAVGLFESKESVAKVWRMEREFEPDTDRESVARLLAKWRRAVATA
ncbi:MAG: glycerol kinase GlpK [Myxococcales bacterium]|nr:glycerol kinase GlpK [Myxococcales bacterium]